MHLFSKKKNTRKCIPYLDPIIKIFYKDEWVDQC